MAGRKLFVSYRRASWSFTYWLVEELEKFLDAEIFVDFSGIDETNFERSLLRNLRESDAVLLIVTEQTFDPARIYHDNDWVRREIREALNLSKPIAMACQNGLFPPADLPDDIQAIRGVQGIEFYPRFFKAAVQELAAFLDRATPIKRRQSGPSSPPPRDVYPTATASHRVVLDEAIALHEAGQYDQAIDRYDQLIAAEYQPRLISIPEFRDRAIAERQAEQRRWEAGELYDEIALLFRGDPVRGAKEYARFLTEYPEFTEDPAGLAQKATEIEGHTAPAPQTRSNLPTSLAPEPTISEKLFTADASGENAPVGESTEFETSPKRTGEQAPKRSPRKSPQNATLLRELEATFIFTPEELQLNRTGELSPRQLRGARFKFFRRFGLLIMAPPVWYGMIILLSTFADDLGLSSSSGTKVVIFGVILLVAITLGCIWALISSLPALYRLSSPGRASSLISQHVGDVEFVKNKVGMVRIGQKKVAIANRNWKGLYPSYTGCNFRAYILSLGNYSIGSLIIEGQNILLSIEPDGQTN